MNLNKCYFSHIRNETEDKVDVSFLLKVENSFQQINFILNPSDNLETLAVRISTNIQKANMEKGTTGRSNIDVSFFNAKDNSLAPKTLCQDLFHLNEQLKLKIDDQHYEVLFDVPRIVNLNLPESILTGFPIYPEYVIPDFVEEEKTTFKWYKGVAIDGNGKEINDIHIKWEFVGIGPSYTPRSQDIGNKLKLECLPGNETLGGYTVEVISKNVVESGPEKCPFETRHMLTTEKLSGKSFRCVSYNILSALYCDTDFTRTVLHPYCPPYALHIDYRKQLIVKELLGYNADVVCLQEVDLKVFKNYLQPLLLVEGFGSNFYRKKRDEEVAEGLACFYRKDRFRILREQTIVLAEALKTETCLQPIWDAIVNNEPLCERLLAMPNVASASILQFNDNPNDILVVGNTHLYYQRDDDHIRLIQGGIVIYWLRDIRNNLLKQNPNKRVTLIICGDFNSVPSCGIYQLYTTGVAPDTLPDWKCNLNETITNLTLEQDISLASAYRTPPYTIFTPGLTDCLDYIYYENSHLEVEQVVPFPSLEQLQAHTALPSIVFPSDHMALISDLRFK